MFKCWLIGKGRANSVITDVFTEINYSCNYMQILHKYNVKHVHNKYIVSNIKNNHLKHIS